MPMDVYTRIESEQSDDKETTLKPPPQRPVCSDSADTLHRLFVSVAAVYWRAQRAQNNNYCRSP